MSTSKVWIVEHDYSPDGPEGVIGVYHTKAAAMQHAQARVDARVDTHGPGPERREYPSKLGIAVSWFDGAAPWGVSVFPYRVRLMPQAVPQ